MFAFRAIVAADGQQPVPSSREHASASASSTRRSLPEVGEFAHTQFMTAMLIVPDRPVGWRRVLGRSCRPWWRQEARAIATARVSDSGSGMGAEVSRQALSSAVYQAARGLLTCPYGREQAVRTPERPVRDEEAAGSNPATPTRSSR
jgi:hypothetical protein